MHVINDFPTDYKKCSTFNIENLSAYKGLAITPYDTSHQLSHDPITNPMTQPAPPNISSTCKEFWWARCLFLPEMEEFSTTSFIGRDDES